MAAANASTLPSLYNAYSVDNVSALHGSSLVGQTISQDEYPIEPVIWHFTPFLDGQTNDSDCGL